MSDYLVELGVKLRTKDIDTEIKKYQNKAVEFKAKLDPTDITNKLNAYKTNKPTIDIDANLITKGITDKISKYKATEDISVKIDPDFAGIESKISGHTVNTPLKVKVDLSWAGVAKQIAHPNFGANGTPKLMMDVDLNDDAIVSAINRYKSSSVKTIPIKIRPDFADLNWSEVESLLGEYEARTPLKVNVQLQKGKLNEAINAYNRELASDSTKNVVRLNARLTDNAVADAIADYKAGNAQKLKIPIDLTFNGHTEFDTELKQKVKSYANTPISIPVRLTPSSKDFAKGITNTPVKINATINQEDIRSHLESAIGRYKPSTKLSVNIQPTMPKDINAQIKTLPKLTEKLDVGIKLNPSDINADIALFKPTATLGIQPDVILENAEDQIRAYIPKEKLKVNIQINDSDIDEKTGKYKARDAISVDIDLNKEDIDAQINAIKPQAKVKVAVKLDFASHKGENGEYIQKGIAKQLKDYNGKTKIKVGVDLDKNSVEQEIQSLQTDTPIKLGIELDPDGVKNVRTQVDDLRRHLEDLEDISININSNVGNRKTSGGNSDVDNITQAAKQSEKLISNAAEKSIRKVTSKRINKRFIIDKNDSDNFKEEMDNLVKEWTNNKGNLVDVKIDTRTSFDEDTGKNIERLHQAQVTYNNELGETIKKTIAWRQIGTEIDADGKDSPIYGFAEVAGKYSKSIDKTKGQVDAFSKQQKRAALDLTNQINQLNRAATDENAARPIKEKGHLNELETKYNKITEAITRMGNASRDTFDDERNEVKRLISEYKSMKSEYQNAENVANKLSGTDYKSGKNIAEQNLAEFKTRAQDYAEMSKTLDKLDTSFGKVGDASSLKEFNNELRVAKAELAKVKAEANATNLSKQLGAKSTELINNIEAFKTANPEVVGFTTKIGDAEVSLESLLTDLSRVKTQGDFTTVNANFRAFKDAAVNAGVALNDIDVKANNISEIKNKLKDTGFEGFTQEVKRARADVEGLNVSSEELDDALNKVDIALDKITAADEAGDMKALVAANKEYEDSLKRLYSLINLFEQAQNNAFNKDILELDKTNAILKLNGLFEDGSQAARRFGAEVQELGEKIKKCANSGDMKKFNKEISILEKQVKDSGLQTKTFGSRLKEQFSRYSQYLSVASVFSYGTQALRSMFEQVKLIDSAMTELKKVTNETDAAYSKFLKNAATRSKEIGTTIDGLVSSTADFARLGYGFKDAQGLAEVANIYAVVGDEIEGVEGATESLISTMAAFKDEMNGMSDADFAMSIVDKFNEIGNNFAISSGGIGEALERSASSLDAANNTIDESIALITAANTVVQDPEAVGTAFKTISMRIRGAKTELEEAGLETEGMVDSTAKLREEILALSGVDIMEDANTFKSTYAIMDELAVKWKNLTDIQQASITELIAGRVFCQNVQKCA